MATHTQWVLLVGKGTQLTYDNVGSTERMLVGLEGGEHFLPVADCADMPRTTVLPKFGQGYICRDSAWLRVER